MSRHDAKSATESPDDHAPPESRCTAASGRSGAPAPVSGEPALGAVLMCRAGDGAHSRACAGVRPGSSDAPSRSPVEGDDRPRLRDGVLAVVTPDDRGPQREEFDRVAPPHVALLLETDADDSRRAELVRLVLHPRHCQLARLVERLSEVGELDVSTDAPHRLPEAAVGDVVHAGPHHEAERHVTGLHQDPEVLARQVRGERFPLAVAVGAAVLGLDGGDERDELGGVRAPLVVVHVQTHADDAVGAELGRLGVHAIHRELACFVHRPGELRQLLALGPPARLDAEVVDRAAHHEAEGMEADLFDQEELVHREVGGEHPLVAGTVLELCQPPPGIGRKALGQVAGGSTRPSCLASGANEGGDFRSGRAGWLVRGRRLFRGALAVHAGLPITRDSSAMRVACVVAASSRRAPSSRRSHSSTPTRVVRIRIPPTLRPMVQTTEPRSTVASSWSSPRLIEMLRISSPLRNLPLRSTCSRSPSAPDSLVTSARRSVRMSPPSARKEEASRSRSKSSPPTDASPRLSLTATGYRTPPFGNSGKTGSGRRTPRRQERGISADCQREPRDPVCYGARPWRSRTTNTAVRPGWTWPAPTSRRAAPSTAGSSDGTRPPGRRRWAATSSRPSTGSRSRASAPRWTRTCRPSGRPT